MAKKFKVGDRVRITDSVSSLLDSGISPGAVEELHGKIGVVSFVDDCNDEDCYQVTPDGYTMNHLYAQWWYGNDQLTKVKK